MISTISEADPFGAQRFGKLGEAEKLYSESQIWGEWSLKPQCSQNRIGDRDGWAHDRGVQSQGAGGRGERTNETVGAAGEAGQKGDKDRQTET